MLRILSTLVAAATVTNAVSVSQSSSYQQRFYDSLAEISATPTTTAPAINCTYNIRRWKKGAADYSTIISSGVSNWTDPDYFSNQSYGILYPSPYTSGGCKAYANAPWMRLNGFNAGYKILGSEGFNDDII